MSSVMVCIVSGGVCVVSDRGMSSVLGCVSSVVGSVVSGGVCRQ